jgi:hypothetical protein
MKAISLSMPLDPKSLELVLFLTPLDRQTEDEFRARPHHLAHGSLPQLAVGCHAFSPTSGLERPDSLQVGGTH